MQEPVNPEINIGRESGQVDRSTNDKGSTEACHDEPKSDKQEEKVVNK